MVSAPSGVLDYPYPSTPIPDAFNEILGLGAWLSPSHWLVEAIDFVFGFNPGEEVGKLVAGDWRGVAVGSAAMTQLAEYTQAVGSAIDQMRSELMATWSGHAADQADAYFDKLALALDDLNEPLNGVASEYNAVAAGMQQSAQLLGGLLEKLLDKLIEIGVKAAAGTALAETVVGAGAMYAWAAYDAYKATQLWIQAVEAINLMTDLVNTTIGLIAGYLGAVNGVNGEMPLPAAYDHPGV